MTDNKIRAKRARLLNQEGTLGLEFETMDRDGHEYDGDLFSATDTDA